MSAVPEIPRHRLPSFWHGMSWTAKCGWLTAAHLARDFSEAAAMLKAHRKPAPLKPTVAAYQARMEALKLS